MSAPEDLPDIDVAQVLLDASLVTEEQIREAVASRRERAESTRLGRVLIDRGLITSDQLREAVENGRRSPAYCPRCEKSTTVRPEPSGALGRCPLCNGQLVTGGEVRYSTTMALLRDDALPPEVLGRMHDPSARFGKFVVVGELGRGGMAVVYKAWDRYFGQFVALKRLRPDLSGRLGREVYENYIKTLFNEARNLVRMRHPNIAVMYDIGRIDKDYYVSLEYLEGSTLQQHFEQSRTRGFVTPYYESPRRYLRHLRDAAAALHYGHTRPSRVVHCDFKPSNLFITQEDRVCVLDFGIARNLRRQLVIDPEDAEIASGTPAYMAPEQAAGQAQDIDPRTDVYQIGAVLYELLTGSAPFKGSVATVLDRVRRDPPEPPREAMSGTGLDIPRDLEELCLHCLEKERSNRPPTAKGVAEALDRAMKRQEAPPPASPGIGHPAVRESAPASRPSRLALAILFLLILGIAGLAMILLRR